MTFVRRRAITTSKRMTGGSQRASRVRLARAVVAVLASVLLSVGTLAEAHPAAAREMPQSSGVSAVLHGAKTHGQALVRKDGGWQTIGAGLFEMTVKEGGTLQSYSVDIDNPSQSQASYEEAPWRASPLHGNRDAGRIRWILEHSYPKVNNLRSLARESGAGHLSPQAAAAGTQVAIWRYSDHAEVKALDPAAEKLADHLKRSARSLPEPKASLSLESVDVAGKSGTLLGPVTVRTIAPSVFVAMASGAASKGVRLVDEHGRKVTSARNGDRLFFDVPAKAGAGATALTVQAATKVPVGRVLTAAGDREQSQTQILAGSSQSTVSGTATASWAESGAIPAARARKNCTTGGVEVSVANEGDKLFRFALQRRNHAVAPGRTAKIAVPVQEDQPYRISIAGPHGLKKTFSGVLDCAAASATGTQSQADASQMRPATVGGDAATDGTGAGGSNLAETGTDDTWLMLSIAVGLVVVGSAAVFAVRRRKPESESDDAGQRGPEGAAGERGREE
jgi:TQXA domain-containing protein/LPXTG-motif cell wall-anchored protein